MKTLLRIAGFIFTACIMVSCNQVKFDRMPGEKLASIPAEMQGTYDVQTDLFKTSKRDSFFVSITDRSIKLIDRSETKEYKVDQDFFIYRLRNYVIIGNHDADYQNLWNLSVLEDVPTGLRVYVISEEKGKPHNLSKMGPYMPEREMPVNHEQIPSMPDPTGGGDPAKPNMLRFVMMNDEQFIQYFEKEIHGKDFIHLKKVKQTVKARKK